MSTGSRLGKLLSLMEEKGLQDLILVSPENIEYYTGVEAVADAVMMLHVSRGGSISLYVPLLEYYRYRDSLPGSIEVKAVTKTLKPSDVKASEKDYPDIVKEIAGSSNRVGVDKSHPGSLTAVLQSLPAERIVDVSEDIWRHRMIKDEEEIAAVRRAVEITIKGIRVVQDNVADGVTEAELAGVFEERVRREGVGKYAFEPIIAFKPNNSYPHTLPGRRRLGKRDLILVDVGVKHGGRCSDLTRMITWGRPSPEERKSLEAVEEALWESIDHIYPGVKAGDVAETAVKVLEKHGLREKFIHGLGHGIGVVVHEPPYLRIGNSTVIEPGMVFTVEPGVYFNGAYGVRMEEDVLVTRKGARVLSGRLKPLLVA
ncbi:M24 family metallopeptidase [Desulfurococcus mucosus]|uniref:Peptidase M24 n=1 Tax=Desulfurococcus mucosus (strain ATCC 35584 / DSM 2162 / JCM 9187 / O7/1) TaxID=765177 RepID=E8R9N7_DESM0|nr:Xaa-Pro peptidase family protein [Desulfurococcus mucosus]ADV65213.1 peptidase M24 [Desulfurococcus mucosus DSM 2162]